jgi:hypothetical protein
MIRRLMRALLKAVVLVGLTLTFVTLMIGQSVQYVVSPNATPCLKVHSDPNSSSAKIDCVVPGTALGSDDSVPYWRRVTLADGRNGWAAKKFLLQPTGPVPDATTIPANAFLQVHFVDVGQGDGIWIHTFDDGIANGRDERSSEHSLSLSRPPCRAAPFLHTSAWC